MRQCGEHLQEALALGKMVLHRSGEEGIDELWGEPFKAFAFPIEDFYSSRYIKIAQTMRAIDSIADAMVETFAGDADVPRHRAVRRGFRARGAVKCETLHTDAEIFDVWASFVAAAERLSCFRPRMPADPSLADEHYALAGARPDPQRQGSDLLHHARARADAQEHARVERALRSLPRGGRGRARRHVAAIGGARANDAGVATRGRERSQLRQSRRHTAQIAARRTSGWRQPSDAWLSSW